MQYTLELPDSSDFFGLVFEDRYLLTKRIDSSSVYVFDLFTGLLKDTVFTSKGDLYITPNGQYFLIVDRETEKSFKVHDSGTGQFLGQIIILNHLQIKADISYHTEQISLTDDRLCAIVSTDTSYLCIAEVRIFKY